MLVLIDDIRQMMSDALHVRGIDSEDIPVIIDDYLDAELEGSRAHGVGRFLVIDKALSNRQGKPTIVAQLGATAHVDGRRELGQLAAQRAALLSVSLAQNSGVGIVTLTNSGRYSRLAPYASIIARSGLVSIVTNNAGPRAVAPFGSRTPILGTNPIAFGFPGEDAPYVVDFSTAQQTWGEIRQAVLEGRPLSDNAFLDINGNTTTAPSEVNAVTPFGGHKGSALCLALELVAGVVAGAQMGSAVNNEYDLGAVFIALTPHRPGTSVNSLAELLNEIRSSQPLPGHAPVVVPGDGARSRRLTSETAGRLDIEAGTLDLLQSMSSGGKGLEGDRLIT